MRRTTRSQRVSPIVRQLTVLVASLFAASATAAPQNYTLSLGVWGRGDGYEVDVPYRGKALDNCDFIQFGFNKHRPAGSFLTQKFMSGGVTVPMAPQDFPGFVVQKALPFGCPSGMGQQIVATAPGSAGAFTLPAGALSRPALGYLVAFSLPDNDALVQAATDGLWQVPYATRGGMGLQGGKGDRIGSETVGGFKIGGTMRTPSSACTDSMGLMQCGNLAPFRKFLKSAWKGGPGMTFNGQTGRAGADFTWCNNGVPGCTTFNGVTPPSGTAMGDGLFVRYKAGPNRFGGTSNQIVNTGGVVGSLFIDIGGFQLIDNVLDAGSGAIQVEGRGYADRITDNLPAATIAFGMFMTGSKYQMALHRAGSPIGQPKLKVITTVMTPQTPIFFKDPAQNIKFGFPLTTGTVIVRDTNVTPPYFVATLTAMGYDCVNSKGVSCSIATGMGARNISLVTGSLAKLTSLGVRTAGVSHMFLPEPSNTGQLLAGVAALIGVAAWRARRARN